MGTPSTRRTDQPPPVRADAARLFECASCGFECHYDDYGRRADRRLVFLEDVYTRQDERVPWRAVCIGAHCTICAAPVCAREPCSVFYCHRLCASCAAAARDVLPPEIRRLVDAARAAPSEPREPGRSPAG